VELSQLANDDSTQQQASLTSSSINVVQDDESADLNVELDESSDSEDELNDTENDSTQMGESDDDIEESEVEPIFEIFADIPKHMKCIAHKLQLVLKDAFEKNNEMISLKKVTFKP